MAMLSNHPLFRTAERRTFTAAVTVAVPNDAGKFDKYKFAAKFAYKTQDQLKELADKTLQETVREVLVGWDLQGDDGAAVPFDDEHKDALLSINSACHALNNAYFLNVSGAAAKN